MSNRQSRRARRTARERAENLIRTRPDLLARLGEQRRFLERSSRLFDEGAEDEAKRLAVSLRILLHDSSTSASLLSQLGVLAGLSFLDSAEQIEPRNLAPTFGLYGMSMGPAGGRWYPFLDAARPSPALMRTFSDWWTRPVTHIPGSGLDMSRRGYVLGIANTEGGAHVDPSLDPLYHALSHANAFGVTHGTLDAPLRPLDNDPVLVGVRQIAHEVQRTLDLSPLLARDIE
jgi:hypothetical protein